MGNGESDYMSIDGNDNGIIEELVLTKQQESCVKYRGQARKDLVIRSAAGGGKSVVLVNRAREFLKEARQINNKNSIAVFTHNHVLAHYLKEQIISDPMDEEYIQVCTVQGYLNEVYEKMQGFKLGHRIKASSYKESMIGKALSAYEKKYRNNKYTSWGVSFWLEEFAWMRNMNIFNANDRKEYMTLERTGRGHAHPMSKLDRSAAFELFVIYQNLLREKKIYDAEPSGNERTLYITHSKTIPEEYIFEHVLLDEAQDQSLANIIALKKMAISDMTICMDVSQRIYEYRWKLSQACITPTSKTLSFPFRCTGQIDRLAESLKAHNEQDEGVVEHVMATADGELPEVIHCSNENEEINYVTMLADKWLKGDPNHTIGIMCYRNAAVDKVAGWLSKAHIPFQFIKKDDDCEFSVTQPGVKLCTMHTSKGLQFTRVILPQFYQGMIPQKWALDNEEDLVKQRNTAYVAMTRAMHQLVIVYNGNESQFLKELDPALYVRKNYKEAVLEDRKITITMPSKRVIPKDVDVENPETDAKEALERERKKELLKRRENRRKVTF